MKYQSQKLAYWFFATCMLLLSLQLIYGFIMGFAHMGYDGLHSVIPFNTARAVHTNLLVVWLLTGFMGAADSIIPDEAGRELYSVKLGYIQLISLILVGVVALIGFHINWWEGRKFLVDSPAARLPGRSECTYLPVQHRRHDLQVGAHQYHRHRIVHRACCRCALVSPGHSTHLTTRPSTRTSAGGSCICGWKAYGSSSWAASWLTYSSNSPALTAK